MVPATSMVMNSGDAFVYDTCKGVIWCWIGSKCIKAKQLKVFRLGLDVGHFLRIFRPCAAPHNVA